MSTRSLPCSRIGVTTRRVEAREYVEVRDALDRNWGPTLARIVPAGVLWMPIPNLGEDVLPFVDGWGLDGIVLTGGSDLGDDPLRDATERVLLDRANNQGTPLFGVCRGMQHIVHHFGGEVRPVDPSRHVGAEHSVTVAASCLAAGMPTMWSVNSFHRGGVHPGGLSESLEAIALSDADGTVEAVRQRELPIAGIMWHPERRTASGDLDTYLMRKHFGWL